MMEKIGNFITNLEQSKAPMPYPFFESGPSGISEVLSHLRTEESTKEFLQLIQEIIEERNCRNGKTCFSAGDPRITFPLSLF